MFSNEAILTSTTLEGIVRIEMPTSRAFPCSGFRLDLSFICALGKAGWFESTVAFLAFYVLGKCQSTAEWDQRKQKRLLAHFEQRAWLARQAVWTFE